MAYTAVYSSCAVVKIRPIWESKLHQKFTQNSQSRMLRLSEEADCVKSLTCTEVMVYWIKVLLKSEESVLFGRLQVILNPLIYFIYRNDAMQKRKYYSGKVLVKRKAY